MENDRRRELRAPTRTTVTLSWQGPDGMTRSATVQAVNSSHSGFAFQCPVDLPVGTTVYIDAQEGYPTGYSLVRYSKRQDQNFQVGVELDEAAKHSLDAEPESLNYYEFLQISPNAQAGTIQRVYRYLAGYFHPDNPETGDPEKFLLLNRAYKALSDPERRAEYDAQLHRKRTQPDPEFASIDFLDSVEGELNRRLAVLAVLYRRCRDNVNDARVSLLDLEAQMGFPRDYLDFTTWYLRNKKLITKEDNSDFSLTATGVDFVEANYEKLPVLHKLLKAGVSMRSHKKRAVDEDHVDETPEALIPAARVVSDGFSRAEP